MITIRKAIRGDMEAVHTLICELAEFEKAPHEVSNTVNDMIQDGFSETPVFSCLVAEDKEKGIVGMAIYFTKYSTWKGKGIYLDDIVVRASERGKGIGKLLFEALLAECKKIRARQLHWQVLDWNERAINFYKQFPVNFDGEWINCKIEEKDL